jgi:hypothetical protein
MFNLKLCLPVVVGPFSPSFAAEIIKTEAAVDL